MLWGDTIHPWNFFYALFPLIKLGFGHMTRVVLVSLCHRRVGNNSPRLWLGQIPVDANVIDKQPEVSVTPAVAGCRILLPPSWLSNKLRRLFTPFLCKIQSRCSSWKVSISNSCGQKKNKCLWFYLLLQRLKNFALISVSDRDFMQVTWGDQQWFGEQSPSPILHKEPNTLCLGSGPSLDQGAAMSIV